MKNNLILPALFFFFYCSVSQASWAQTPPAPSFVNAGITGSSSVSVGINWNYKAPHTIYEIWRSPSVGGPYSLIYTKPDVNNSSQASWIDSDGIQPVTEYCYKVKTVSNSGVSSPFSPNDCYTTPDLPPPPTYIMSGQVTDSNGQGIDNVAINFPGYSTTTNSSGNYVISNINSGLTGAVVPSKTNYVFDPTSIFESVDENITGVDFTGTPTVLVPPNVSVSTTANSIYFNWNSIAGATQYEIISTENGTPIYTQNTYLNYNGLNSGANVCITVKACNSITCSSSSSQVCGEATYIPPNVTGLAVNLNFNNEPVLTWNSVSNITHYEVERQVSGQNWTVISSNIAANTTTYVDSNVQEGFTYSYRMKACDNSNCSSGYSNVISITIPTTQSSIQITFPSGGEIFVEGQMITIMWENTNFSGNVSLSYNIDGTIITLASNVLNNGSFSWTIPVILNTYTQSEILISSTDGQIDDISNQFTVEPTSNATCYYSDIVGTPVDWANEAAVYLCENDVLNYDDNLAQPTEEVNRAELAKMIFYAVDLHLNNYVSNSLHYWPNPFYDLQLDTAWYKDYALALSYLEYDGDCISVFDKSYFNFKPSNPIERRFVLKALLEAWNIPLTNSGNGTLPFTDVPVNDPMYDYIYTAWSNGIIQGDNGGSSTFRPTDFAIRAEAFVMIYNMMQTYGVPAINDDDFYMPGNYTPANMASAGSMHSGNFNFYSKTSFAISSIGMPLTFGHTYNSYFSDLPREFFAIQPMGDGWSHSFNMYLMDIKGDVYHETNDNRIIILLPSGGIYVFRQENGTYIAETEGVYATLTKVNATTFQFLTKDQITYTFVKENGTHTDFPYTLKQIKDRNNNLISLNYESAEIEDEVRLKEVMGTAGRKFTFHYHSNKDLLQRVNDPIDRNIFYNYAVQANAKEQLTVFINAKSDPTYYNYVNDECKATFLASIQLPKGNTVTVGFEDRKLNSIQTAGNTPTDYVYQLLYGQNSTSVVMNTMNATSGNTSTTSNHLGLATEMSGPGYMASVSYDRPNQPMVPSTVTVNERMSSYVYDTQGNVLQINLPENVTHKYTYTPFNDVDTYTDPNNETYNFGYNPNGNLTSSDTPRPNSTTQYIRNANGTLAAVISPSSITVNFGYDSYGNVNSTSAPLGINTSATYDAASRVLTSTNPNGQLTAYGYDENDNLVSHFFSGSTGYTYDENDNLLTVTNANTGVTTMMYDEENDFLKEVAFGGFRDRYTYYEDGRLHTKTDPENNVFTSAYDNLKRLDSVNSANDNVSYTYGANNNIVGVQNVNGLVSLEQDSLDRLTSTTDFYNQTVGYEYDPAGNVVEITYPDSKTISYTYYSDNLLESVVDWNDNTIATYTYRNDGFLETTTYGNGTTCTFSYDAAGRNTGHTWTDNNNNNNVICGYTREFDAYGNITIESPTEPLAPNIPIAQSITSTHNNINQAENFGSIDLDHTPNGEVSEKGMAVYTFDDYERLVNYFDGTNTFSYTYDGMGNRRQSIRNGTTTRYVLDINGMSQVLMETDGSNTPTAYYIYGLGLAARVLPDGSIHYYHGDYRSSTVAMTDNTGTITHQYAYGPYGELWASDEPSGDVNRFRYVGGQGVQYEKEDLYFMRARFYDPEMGRFLSEDPIWGVNLFGYAGENPINQLDVSGMTWQSVAENTYKIIVSGGSIGNSGVSIYKSEDGFEAMTNALGFVNSLPDFVANVGVTSNSIKVPMKSLGNVTGGIGLTLSTISEGKDIYDEFKETGTIDAQSIPKALINIGIGGLTGGIDKLFGIDFSSYVHRSSEYIGHKLGRGLYQIHEGYNSAMIKSKEEGFRLGGKLYRITH